MYLRLTHIVKKYGSNVVLQFEDFEIGSGVFWLKGGDGTGKTTLFRMIVGQTPFHGEIEIDGISLKKQPIIFKSKISYAEAEPQYPLFITGNELLNFYREVRGASKKEVDELSELFNMQEFLEQKIGGYSSGMLKKLSLICAFLGDVEYYILDEPLITIDVASAEKLYNLIKLKAAQGKTFLLSSHQEINDEHLNIDAVFQIQHKNIVRC